MKNVAKRGPGEHEIQGQILDYLKFKAIFHWRNNSGAMTGAHKGKRWFMRFGALGSPDIFAVKSGQIYGIEVKGPKGSLSDHQNAYCERFRACGGVYILAHELEDVTAIL